MSENEQADLNKMREEIHRRRDLTFSICHDIIRHNGDPKFMNMIGRGKQTVDQAVCAVVKDGLREIDNIVKAHVKKYPD